MDYCLNCFLEGVTCCWLLWCSFVGRQRGPLGVLPPRHRQVLPHRHRQLWGWLRPPQISWDLRPPVSVQKMDKGKASVDQQESEPREHSPHHPPDCGTHRARADFVEGRTIVSSSWRSVLPGKAWKNELPPDSQ